jgi:hypothetical protein
MMVVVRRHDLQQARCQLCVVHRYDHQVTYLPLLTGTHHDRARNCAIEPGLHLMEARLHIGVGVGRIPGWRDGSGCRDRVRDGVRVGIRGRRLLPTTCRWDRVPFAPRITNTDSRARWRLPYPWPRDGLLTPYPSPNSPPTTDPDRLSSGCAMGPVPGTAAEPGTDGAQRRASPLLCCSWFSSLCSPLGALESWW